MSEFSFMVRMINKGLGMVSTAAINHAKKQWERPPAPNNKPTPTSQPTQAPQFPSVPHITDGLTADEKAHFTRETTLEVGKRWPYMIEQCKVGNMEVIPVFLRPYIISYVYSNIPLPDAQVKLFWYSTYNELVAKAKEG